MLLTVHDELVLEVPVDERDEVEPVVRDGDGERRPSCGSRSSSTWASAPTGPRRSSAAALFSFRFVQRVSWEANPDCTAERASCRNRHGRVTFHDCRGTSGRPSWFNPVASSSGRRICATRSRRGPSRRSSSSSARSGSSGQRVLDVGCGPGRHSLALARRASTSSASTSRRLRALARGGRAEGITADFHERDVRTLGHDGEFDAVICLCQGGFGLLGGHDETDVSAGSCGRSAPAVPSR